MGDTRFTWKSKVTIKRKPIFDYSFSPCTKEEYKVQSPKGGLEIRGGIHDYPFLSLSLSSWVRERSLFSSWRRSSTLCSSYGRAPLSVSLQLSALSTWALIAQLPPLNSEHGTEVEYSHDVSSLIGIKKSQWHTACLIPLIGILHIYYHILILIIE